MKALKSMRLHIAIFGKTNVGKSSLMNRLTEQDVSIVSDIAGTTTDVVEKSMELLPVGPVTFLDTAGLDDKTKLSKRRIEKTKKVINRTDIAVIMVDYNGLGEWEIDLIRRLNELKIPFFVLVNKADEKEIDIAKFNMIMTFTQNIILTSTVKDAQLVHKFKNVLINLLPEDFINPPAIVRDLIKPKSTVVLVIPVDKEAPKGRIILPQVQTLRDLLDGNCVCVVTKESELSQALKGLRKAPSLVITDSQAFKTVNEIVPEEIPLTSFSILLARIKGDIGAFIEGVYELDRLKSGDKILVLESCTHHAIDDDIARVKIPALIKQKTGKDFQFEYYTGHDFPPLDGYKMVIHCGACMTNRREVLSRILIAHQKRIPITNYGIIISHCLGILPRATEIFNALI